MAQLRMPPGFRFHPTDEELVAFYLKRKVQGRCIDFDVISVVDLYKCEPWDLPEKSCIGKDEQEWYFFCARDKKYPNGSRTNRATADGYWKSTGKDRPVRSGHRPIGMKKTLIYYRGRAPYGERTDWVMHEYRMDDKGCDQMQRPQDAFVLARIFKKSGPGPKNGEQYGAVFVEEAYSTSSPTESSKEPPLDDAPSEETAHLLDCKSEMKLEEFMAGEAVPPESAYPATGEWDNFPEAELVSALEAPNLTEDTLMLQEMANSVQQTPPDGQGEADWRDAFIDHIDYWLPEGGERNLGREVVLSNDASSVDHGEGFPVVNAVDAMGHLDMTPGDFVEINDLVWPSMISGQEGFRTRETNIELRPRENLSTMVHLNSQGVAARKILFQRRPNEPLSQFEDFSVTAPASLSRDLSDPIQLAATNVHLQRRDIPGPDPRVAENVFGSYSLPTYDGVEVAAMNKQSDSEDFAFPDIWSADRNLSGAAVDIGNGGGSVFHESGLSRCSASMPVSLSVAEPTASFSLNKTIVEAGNVTALVASTGISEVDSGLFPFPTSEEISTKQTKRPSSEITAEQPKDKLHQFPKSTLHLWQQCGLDPSRPLEPSNSGTEDSKQPSKLSGIDDFMSLLPAFAAESSSFSSTIVTTTDTHMTTLTITCSLAEDGAKHNVVNAAVIDYTGGNVRQAVMSETWTPCTDNCQHQGYHAPQRIGEVLRHSRGGTNFELVSLLGAVSALLCLLLLRGVVSVAQQLFKAHL